MADPENLLIQDTAWDGYETIPRWIVEGYATMLFEVDEQLAEHHRAGPTVVAVQCGVGSLASAVVTHFRRPGLDSPPDAWELAQPRASWFSVPSRQGNAQRLPARIRKFAFVARA